MASVVREALRTQEQEFHTIADPADRVRAIGDFFAALDVELEVLVSMRLDATAQLRRQGNTYDQIAELTGLSKARVAQLARQASPSANEAGPQPSS